MNEMMTRPTLLTRKDLTVIEILNEKAKATSPEQAVDYVEYTDTLISNELEQIKQAKKELSLLEAHLKSEQERIKIGAAEWLDSLGVDKLNGLRVSSLTTYTPKSKEVLKIEDEEFFIKKGFGIEVTTTTISPDLLKEWLAKNPKSKKATLEIIHKQPMITINKRKV